MRCRVPFSLITKGCENRLRSCLTLCVCVDREPGGSEPADPGPGAEADSGLQQADHLREHEDYAGTSIVCTIKGGEHGEEDGGEFYYIGGCFVL